MKTRRMYATAAFVSIVLASCTQQEEPGAGLPTLAGTPMRITTQVAQPETRQEMVNDDLNAFYLRVTDQGGTTADYDFFTKMEKQADGTWKATEGAAPTWGETAAQVSAVAQKTADGGWEQWSTDDYDSEEGKTVSVLADQSADDSHGVKASDLLYMPATAADPAKPGEGALNEQRQVVVAMKHVFAKLEITLNVGTEFDDGTDTNPIARLDVAGTRLKGTFVPATGGLTADETIADNDPAPIQARQASYTPAATTDLSFPAPKGKAVYECIVMPQTVSLGNFQVTATIGGKAYTYVHILNDITFDGNKKYTLTLNVGRNKMEISGDINVGDFEEKIDMGDFDMGNIDPAELLVMEDAASKSAEELETALTAAIAEGQTTWLLKGTMDTDPIRNAVYGSSTPISLILPDMEEIKDNAFYYFYSDYKGTDKLESLFLPKAKKIGNEAFNVCKGLKEIYLPETTEVGNSAFSYCENLTNVNLSKVIKIGSSAFFNCSQLTSINLPEATEIGNYAFQSCGFTEVNLPKATTIGESAFGYNKNLTNISLPEATSVPYQTFLKCDRLAKVDLPKVTELPSEAFNGLTNLKEVNLPNVTKITGRSAFEGCIGLTSISLPKATVIYSETFKGCTNLEEIDLPEATHIDSEAFHSCIGLTEINLPKVTYLHTEAFVGCTGITALIFGTPFALQGQSESFSIPKPAEITLTLHPEQAFMKREVNSSHGGNYYWVADGLFFDKVEPGENKVFARQTFKEIKKGPDTPVE